MASFSALRPLLRAHHRRPGWICPQCTLRLSSTSSDAAAAAPQAPPLLLKLRSDLKTAMRAKDTARLNVLKTVLAEVTNAAKTSKPIASDMQLLSLLRKRAAASQSAAREFDAAGRSDLVKKEREQGRVLEEYVGGVEVMAEEDVRRGVREAMGAEGEKVAMGDVLKKLMGPGGMLEGANVEKATVVGIVREEMGKKG